MRIGICIPTHDQWKAEFGISLVEMVATCPHEMGMFNVKLPILPWSRQYLAEIALEQQCTHVLFLDTDMIFPEDTVTRMLQHDLPIVATNYRKKFDKYSGTAVGLFGRVADSRKKKGKQTVAAAGMGCAMIRAEVFENIKKPWFQFEYTKHGFIPEDYYFFKKAIKAGYPCVVDHDLSRDIGHIGDKVYATDGSPATTRMIMLPGNDLRHRRNDPNWMALEP